MTYTRRLALALLCCAIALSAVCSVQATVTQKLSGSYSSVTPLTERSRAWFAETFRDYETLEEVLWAVNRFACGNFRYTPQNEFIIQTFDPDKFLFDLPYEGVCFEFSCFCKCAVLVWAEQQGRTDIRCYVYSVKLPDGQYHAVNLIYEGDALYYIDLTTNSTLYQRGDKAPGLFKVLTTPEEFFENRGYEITDIN